MKMARARRSLFEKSTTGPFMRTVSAWFHRWGAMGILSSRALDFELTPSDVDEDLRYGRDT